MTKIAFIILALLICLSYISCGSCGSDSNEETTKKTINLTINGIIDLDTLSESIKEEDEPNLISRSDITSPVPSPMDTFFKGLKNIDSDSLKDVAIMALITDSSTPDNPELTESNFVEHILSWAMVEESGDFTITADLDENESFIVWIFLPFYDFTAELSSKLKRNVKAAQTDSEIGILIKVSDLEGNAVQSAGESDDTFDLNDIEVSLGENGTLAGTTQTSLSESESSSDISISQIDLSSGTISVAFAEEIEQNTLTTSSFKVTNSNGESLCESVDYNEDNFISTCKITPPDCEEFDNYTLTVTGVTDLDGNTIQEFTEIFSTLDDHFYGDTLSDCWILTGNTQEIISVKDGELTYLSEAQNEEDSWLSKTLNDTSYSVGIHISNTDLSDINKKQAINFVLQNDIATYPTAAIQLGNDGNVALKSGINDPSANGVEVGDSFDITAIETYLCLARDGDNASVYYSSNGESWTELSLPEHSLNTPSTSAFTLHFVDYSTGTDTWSPTISAVKFLNLNDGDDYTCPTF